MRIQSCQVRVFVATIVCAEILALTLQHFGFNFWLGAALGSLVGWVGMNALNATVFARSACTIVTPVGADTKPGLK